MFARSGQNITILTGLTRFLITLCSYGFLATSTLNAQNVLIQKDDNLAEDINPKDVIHWEAIASESYTDGSILIGLRLQTENEFTLYKEKVEFTPPQGFTVEKIKDPPTRELIDPVLGGKVQVYYGGEFEIIVKPSLTAANNIPNPFPFKIKYLGCTQRICLFPYTETLELNIFSKNVSLKTDKNNTSTTPSISTLNKENNSNSDIEIQTNKDEEPEAKDELENELVKKMQEQKLSLWMLLLFTFLGGLATNLTPCVYPMIPITIRVLAGQSKSPINAAIMYATGILVTYTSLGVFAAFTGSLFGSIMASPTFNIFFGAIMILFGISMLGFGNFTSLQTIGSKIGAGKASLKNAFLMGTGAGLVASPCTGPVLAFLLAYATKRSNISESILLLIVYSLGFSLPYVALGGVAARAASMRVPARIQIGVKALFASVMFALGLYYLRIPAYGLIKPLSDSWLVIAEYSFILGCSIIIAGIFVPTIYEKKGFLIIPTLVFGISIFAGSQWLSIGKKPVNGDQHLTWIKSEAEGLKLARENNRPVLIDAWAEWCEACKKMDRSTFADKKVIEFLKQKQFVLIKLDLTEATDENDIIMQRYQIHSLPTLTILPKGASIKDKYSILGFVTAPVLINKLNMFDLEQ
ncbi:MAG: cytochrome c biogenesis protein CcdA [Bdellovibrionota bacterium]